MAAGAEVVVPRAKVVKAFNTSFASTMDRGEVGGEKLTVFAAGDDDALLNIRLGYNQKMGTDMGLRLVH